MRGEEDDGRVGQTSGLMGEKKREGCVREREGKG